MSERPHIDSEIDRRDPNLCRFTSPHTLYVGARTVETKESATDLPLAQKIMGLAGVRRLQLIGHLLVVHKNADRNWDELIREVESVLTSYLISGEALTPDDVEQHRMLIGRSTREKVQYLIDAQINPGVAEHGGSVQVVEVNDDKLYLRLHGGCQGCSAADFTLKQGIEAIVKRAVPEIQQVIDLTNHSAGLSPYYRRVDRPDLAVN